MRIERTTSPLPRECSTTELQEQILERENGIEPSYAAWKAAVLPLNYSRTTSTTSASRQPGLPFFRGSAELRRFAMRRSPQDFAETLCSPIEPLPHIRQLISNLQILGGEGWIRTSVLVRGQIYSLLPLTTRPPLHGTKHYPRFQRKRQRSCDF